MAVHTNYPVEARKKFVEAWNKVMIDIWQERIWKLDVVDTAGLYKSTAALDIVADKDGRYLDIRLSQEFLEYGIWQDLGTGREVPVGNPGDIGHDKVREPRRWFSTAYYSSAMNLRDFLAESIGEEFVGMFAKLDAEDLRKDTAHYRSLNL